MARILLLLLFASPLTAQPGYFEPWGNGAELNAPRAQRSERPPSSLAARCANTIIRFHQEVISPVDGPRSHFRPTSSRYMQLAIERYGFIKGYLMGCDRLLRENDEEWVYRKIEIDGRLFKYDPAKADKYD